MELEIQLVEKATSDLLLALPLSRDFNWGMFGIDTLAI